MPEKFWILESPKVRTAIWDVGNLWKASDYQRCVTGCCASSCVGFGGPATRLSELRVIIKSFDLPDIAWTVTDCLLSKRVMDMFREQGFSGMEGRQARVKWQPTGPGCSGWLSRPLVKPTAGEAMPKFWELIVTGWGGMAGVESGLKRNTDTNVWEGYPDWSRIVDWDSWDGSDFFMVWPFGFTRLVTDRVAQFIQQHHLVGAKLISPEEYTKQYIRWRLDKSVSMRLRDFFPDQRAREIGEPLGIY